tara:strand:- start:83 stop:916 length:834 start_codon:yes stop_codon:yes gene_type:complete
MRKPNLFLVGAPKAGSTLLWTILKEHKDIFFSENPEKEINYFSYDELVDSSYYKDYKINKENDYLKAFKSAQSVKYLADGSVSYFSYPSIPKKIYEFNSDAKIIIIVRDPFIRAFSHYSMDRRMGYATKPFSEYLINKDNQHAKFIHQYIQNSLYFKNTTNYLKYFTEDQVCILQLENINSDIQKIYKFLDIEKLNMNVNYKKVNANKEPINIISKTLQHNRFLATTLKKFIPKKIIDWFNFLLYKEAQKVTLMKSDLNLLEDYINEDYTQFKKHIL